MLTTDESQDEKAVSKAVVGEVMWVDLGFGGICQRTKERATGDAPTTCLELRLV